MGGSFPAWKKEMGYVFFTSLKWKMIPPNDALDGRALKDQRLGTVLKFFWLIGMGSTSLIRCKGPTRPITTPLDYHHSCSPKTRPLPHPFQLQCHPNHLPNNMPTSQLASQPTRTSTAPDHCLTKCLSNPPPLSHQVSPPKHPSTTSPAHHQKCSY